MARKKAKARTFNRVLDHAILAAKRLNQASERLLAQVNQFAAEFEARRKRLEEKDRR